MEKFEHKLTVKLEDGSKIEIPIGANLTGLNLDNFTDRGLRDFAANSVKVVRDGAKSQEEFAASFQELVEKYSRGEKAAREKGVGVPGITPLVQAARDSLENVVYLKGGLTASTASKGEVKEARTQVRTYQKENHAWWKIALSKAE